MPDAAAPAGIPRLAAPRDAARLAFSRHAQRIAFVEPGERSLTFAELGSRVFELAAGLRAAGLVPGDRVSFTLPNTLEFVELRLACHEAGLVAVPLIWDLSAQGRTRALLGSGAKLYVYDPALDPAPPDGGPRSVEVPRGDRAGFESLFRRGAGPSESEIDPLAPATINFTSGTTGTPKGVVSTHRAWSASLTMLAGSELLRPGEREVFMHAIPLATAGWGTVLPAMLAGAAGLLLDRWEPALALESVARHRVTRTLVTPSMLIDWLETRGPEDRGPSPLRAVICGTASLHAAKAAEAQDRLGPVLCQGYGLAEVLPPLALLPPEEYRPREHPYRVGRPARGTTVRVVGPDGVELPAGERGTIEVTSPTTTAGYWQRPDLDARAFAGGFFRTGDEGFLDADGYLNVLGRADERVPGVAAHPREIEELAHQCEAVKECALVAGPDSRPVLVCSRRKTAAVTPEARRFLAGSVPGGRVTFADGDLPRSAAGKIVRGRIVPADASEKGETRS